jgi:SAM-dependent methyltransferase
MGGLFGVRRFPPLFFFHMPKKKRRETRHSKSACLLDGLFMTAMTRYRWDSPEYAEAFAALLRSYGSREHLYSLLRDLLARSPADAAAIDWGAGTGDLTRVLLERARKVYAVEPSAAMRETLAANCPAAQVIDGTIMSAEPPGKVHVAVLSHVLYHIPDHQWAAHVIRAAGFLAPDGVLLVALKDPDSGCNRMLEHFGAPPFDLFAALARVVRRHREFDFAFSHSPHTLRTASFEDTLRVARFMMADRAEGAFSCRPTESQFQEYVRSHFWDEQKKVGGWWIGDVYCLVRPNPRWA